MWGIFIGIALGVMQMLVLRVIGNKLLSSKETWVKLTMLLILIAKIALIVFILYLMYSMSIAHVIWTAVGMLIGLIVVSVIWIKRRNIKD